MSDTGSNDPYQPPKDGLPKDGGSGATPPPPPQWGSNPPAAPDQPGQFGQPQYGQPQFGQPQYGQLAGSPPPNYLVWAILSTLLCCLPLGIASIVFAAQVNGKYAAGDVAGAQQSSAKAKKFAIWSAVVGLVLGVLYIILFVVLASNSDTSY